MQYQRNGRYSPLRPNPNPNSEYGKWLREERRRSWEGLVDPSTGMWITGDLYFFLNYCPIQLIKKDQSGKSIRVVDFPNFWDGHCLITHYLSDARSKGHHASELASRGKGKAHPYSERVLTPSGWRMWGDLQIGDSVYGDNGKPTLITAIPFDGITDIYELTPHLSLNISYANYVYSANFLCRPILNRIGTNTC